MRCTSLVELAPWRAWAAVEHAPICLRRFPHRAGGPTASWWNVKGWQRLREGKACPCSRRLGRGERGRTAQLQGSSSEP